MPANLHSSIWARFGDPLSCLEFVNPESERPVNEFLLFTVNQIGQSQAPAGSGLAGLMPLVLMFVIFYFLLIRPQKKRQQAHAEMINRLKKGDEIVTAGGVVGSIFALTDSELVVEVADRVKIRVLRNQVQMYKAAEEAAEKEE